MKLTIVSPTYNEAQNVGPLIEQVRVAMSGIDYEIVIVDDNSPDRTWSVVEEIGKSDSRVRAIRRMQNPGLGPAVIDGFVSARGEMVACIDADLQHDPGILPKLLEAVTDGSEVAVGSRYVPGGGTGNWNIVRRFESWVATKIAQIFLGVKLRDPMSGYFLMRRQDFIRVEEQLNAKGFKILLEIFAKLHPRKVQEVPYTFRTRLAGESKLTGKVVLQYLEQVWRLSKLGAMCPDRFLKFVLVGASGIVVNLLALAVLFRMSGLRDWRASAIVSLIANVSNYTLNNIWTFADRVHKGWAVMRGYSHYLLMSAVGLLVSTTGYAGMAWSLKRLLLSQMGLNQAPTWLLLSCQFLAVVLGTYFNYQLNKHITWPRAKDSTIEDVKNGALQFPAHVANQESQARL
jgi:dolichol-phosphate mannosyltransferase